MRLVKSAAIVGPLTITASGTTFVLKDDGSGNVGLFINGIESITFTSLGALKFARSAGTISQYKAINTAGVGVPAIYANVVAATRSTTFTNAINYTPPATAGKYRITANQIITATTGTTIATLTYKDASGAAQSQPITFNVLGSITPTIAPAATGVFSGTFEFDIDNSATAITVTFTVSATATYWPSATLEQLA